MRNYHHYALKSYLDFKRLSPGSPTNNTNPVLLPLPPRQGRLQGEGGGGGVRVPSATYEYAPSALICNLSVNTRSPKENEDLNFSPSSTRLGCQN